MFDMHFGPYGFYTKNLVHRASYFVIYIVRLYTCPSICLLFIYPFACSPYLNFLNVATVALWRSEDVKMRYRPPLLEEPCAQTLSGIMIWDLGAGLWHCFTGIRYINYKLPFSIVFLYVYQKGIITMLSLYLSIGHFTYIIKQI